MLLCIPALSLCAVERLVGERLRSLVQEVVMVEVTCSYQVCVKQIQPFSSKHIK